MQIKEEKQYDALNSALMARIVNDLGQTYTGERQATFVLAIQYITQHYETKELLQFFEKEYAEGDKTVYPVYRIILDNTLGSIDKGVNKYRKFRRIIDKLEEELETLQSFNITELPIQLLVLDFFLTYTLKGKDFLQKELSREQDPLTEGMEQITKAFICLFHLAQIKGVARQRDNVELMATEVLKNSIQPQPKSDIEVIFNLLQEGFY